MSKVTLASRWAKAKNRITLILWLAAAGGLSCVETAECDESITCPEQQVCYELVCLDICTRDADCPNGQSCVSCREDDGTGVVDHCFGGGERVCLIQAK